MKDIDSIDLFLQFQAKTLENVNLLQKITDLHNKSFSFLSRAVFIVGFALIILAAAFIIHCLKGC